VAIPWCLRSATFRVRIKRINEILVRLTCRSQPGARAPKPEASAGRDRELATLERDRPTERMRQAVWTLRLRSGMVVVAESGGSCNFVT